MVLRKPGFVATVKSQIGILSEKTKIGACFQALLEKHPSGVGGDIVDFLVDNRAAVVNIF
jgi:hypothetical protein